MNHKTISLRAKLLIYFLIFSALILLFLYIFQILFLNTYYKIHQANNLTKTVNKIEDKYKTLNIYDLDKISMENDICIQIIDNNKIKYSSTYVKHCAGIKNKTIRKIKEDFIKSNEKTIKVEFLNKKFHNKSLFYGKRINSNTYIITNISLQPIDKSIELLKNQFIYVVLLAIILSIIISFDFSNRISIPIIKLSKTARKIAKKEYNENIDLKTDIYELKQLEESLNYTIKQLKKADETQHEFLANVGHDLKTPLTMIKAYASSAKELNYNNKKKREEDLKIIIDEAERLNNLVNDILVLTKIQNSISNPHKEKVNITEFIKDSINYFKIYENQGYKFIFNCSTNYYINIDKKLLQRVLYNLIINAINYTGKDKKIIISLKRIENLLKVCITDTGKGISEKEKELVWNKYYTIDKSYHRNKNGTGLGLAIVKEIFIAHNYEYGIESKKGKGSTFYFICKLDNEKK